MASQKRFLHDPAPNADNEDWPELQEPSLALEGQHHTGLPALPERVPVASEGLAPPQTSAGERLVRFAYRLGIPGPALARPFGRPARLRLLATAESPLLGNRVAGVALRAGHFLVHGSKVAVAQMNYGPAARLAPPVERVVHGFTWLADLAACAPAPDCAATAEAILADWLAANPQPSGGAAWKPGNAGRRLLGWLVNAPLILSGSDRSLRTGTMRAIEQTARWLDREAVKADDRLDEVAAWCGVVAAGLLLPDGGPRRLHGEAGLFRALGELVGADGGVLSRSPLAQIEAIELLVELGACYQALRETPPPQFTALLHLLVPPLHCVIHSDGGLGSWQGAAGVSSERVTRLLALTGVRARPLADARQWGYQRLAAGRSVLQFDAAPPPLARHARHGCASTLAFEFSHGAHRLVVNCGGAATAGGLIPARIEQGLRATAAHSALVLGDANSTAVLANGKLGTGVSAVEVDRRRDDGPEAVSATILDASHDGYATRFGLVHRRALRLSDDGFQLCGEDLLVPSGRRARNGKLVYALRFHLGPGVEVELGDQAGTARLDLPDGSSWVFMCEGGGPVELDESLWVDADGTPQEAVQLVIQGQASRAGEQFAWMFERIRTGVR